MHIFKKRQNICKRKLQNKAQTSFFMILGTFMIIALIIGFFVYNNIKKSKAEEEAKKISDLSLQADEVQKFVNDCIRKASFEGLIKLGQTGGYFEVPTLINFKGSSYWHLDQVNIQPFLNQTQERLLAYMAQNIPKCVENENLSKYGFIIEKGEPLTFIEFGNADVTIKVNYPIKLSKESYTKQFSEFFNTFDIRYRAIFEAATEVNEKTFDADFDEKNPLKKLDYLKNLDFDVSYKNPETDVVTFTVTDKKSITPANQLYTFNFAAKIGKSELKKITDMQNRSASNPTVLPYTIFSVDKKAQLDISASTTISKDGQDLSFISVQQSYPTEAVTKDVPVYKKNKDVMQKQDIKYIVDNPVYSFEPTGILFNQFQKLTLYYDKSTDDSKGVGILMGKNGFWVPITSKHEPENKKVFSNILGFTEFTAVACASQNLKETIAEHLFEPNAGCYVSLAVFVISILLIFTVFLSGLAAAIGVAATAAAEGTALSVTQFISLAWVSGLSTIGGAVGVSIGTLSLAITAISLASTAMTIVGSTTDAFYGASPDQCETFYPTCDQNINIEEGGDAEEGKCIPKDSTRVAAGAPTVVCAQVESCGSGIGGYIEKTLCKSCSKKCTAKFY